MKKTCLYSHFFTKDYIPNYVIYYLEKLKEIVGDIYLLTNMREISNLHMLDELGIKYFLYPNTGFDFGMYYKFFKSNDIDCDQLIISNDSMVLFNDLLSIDNWINKNKEIDMLGLTDSLEISHHLQSYFLVMNKRTQIEFKNYLNVNGILDGFTDVIRIYEVGFNQHLLLNGFNIKAKYSCFDYATKSKTNSIIHFSKKLINNDMPMIKRKVIFNLFKDNERKFLYQIDYDFKVDHWNNISRKLEDNLNINYLKEL